MWGVAASHLVGCGLEMQVWQAGAFGAPPVTVFMHGSWYGKEGRKPLNC